MTGAVTYHLNKPKHDLQKEIDELEQPVLI
jgi:hypothetical protein